MARIGLSVPEDRGERDYFEASFTGFYQFIVGAADTDGRLTHLWVTGRMAAKRCVSVVAGGMVPTSVDEQLSGVLDRWAIPAWEGDVASGKPVWSMDPTRPHAVCSVIMFLDDAERVGCSSRIYRVNFVGEWCPELGVCAIRGGVVAG